MEFKPKFNEYKEKANESFDNQAFMKLINCKLVRVDPGYCEIQLPYDKTLTQQHGFFHAGIVATLADNAAGYAGYSLMGQESSVLTVEFKINLIAPADGEELLAKSTVLKYGRTLTVCRSDVYVLKDGQKTQCATALVTLIELYPKVHFKK